MKKDLCKPVLNDNQKNSNFIFTGTCRAGSGVVAAVTGYLAQKKCYICSLQQFDDESTDKFFMRAVFRPHSNTVNISGIKSGFGEVARDFEMDWNIHNPDVPVKTIIMVSKYDHCLDDILYRLRKNEFNMKIYAVISNHADLGPMVEREGIRFVHLPITPETKAEQEEHLLELIHKSKVELIVLARYMQILSKYLSGQLLGRCINIHHSFLPGFKGANPYQQAFARGVKVIGATAHYVTPDLDEGPIIEQVVTRVDHSHTPERLERVGRDNECIALARAITYHTERRVFLDGNKTVIFGS